MEEALNFAAPDEETGRIALQPGARQLTRQAPREMRWARERGEEPSASLPRLAGKAR